MIRLFLATIGLGYLAMAAVAGDEKADELKKFQGLWRIVQMNTGDGGSATIPKRDLARMAVEFKGNTLIWDEKGEKQQSTFIIDPAKKPKTIEWIMAFKTPEGEKGKLVEEKATILGIYSLEGNQLKLCLSNSLDEKAARPKEFRPARGIILMILEKSK
jgi:uncharacterized protein (TIGR03067 family)